MGVSDASFSRLNLEDRNLLKIEEFSLLSFHLCPAITAFGDNDPERRKLTN